MTNREELYDLNRDPKEQASIVLSSPGEVSHARSILAADCEMARRLREIHGTNVEEQSTVEEELMQRLKALGYVQ